MTIDELRAGMRLAMQSTLDKLDEDEREAMRREGYDAKYIHIRQQFVNASRRADIETVIDETMAGLDVPTILAAADSDLTIVCDIGTGGRVVN